MFENFMQGGGDNPLLGQLQQLGLNPEQAKQTIPVAEETVTETVKQEASNGNISGLLSMFNGGANAQNPIVTAMSGSFIQNLIAKVGLPASLATTVSTQFLPQILNQFQAKAKDESGNVSESGLLSTFGLGNLGSIVGGLKDKLGGFGNLLG